MDIASHAEAVDLFSPINAGSYQGAIKPGIFVEAYTRDGHRHGVLGLELDIGETELRIVRITFLLDSPTAIEAAKRDVDVLTKWAELVKAPPAPKDDWQALVERLWVEQQALNLRLMFDIRRARDGRSYNLLDVKAAT